MSKRVGRKRLAVDIPVKLHNALGIIAQSRNITLTRYVMRALIRYSMHESKYEDNLHLLCEYKDIK